MNELLKVKEIKDLTDDYNKCDYYLNELNRGNIKCLREAILFSEKKYNELLVKDCVITLANKNPFPSKLDNVSQTKINLNALKKIISEIILKKDISNIENINK